MTRQLVIGDIHGCSTALDRLAEELRFGAGDLIVTLGDYVDRGPDSRGVIDYLIALRESCELVTLRGNHEVMMLEARYDRSVLTDWLTYGGDKTLDSYGVRSLDQVPASHWAFLEQTQRYFETERDFFVHANVFAAVSLAEQPDYQLFWEPFVEAIPHRNGKRMICGHTSQKTGRPKDRGCALCIDTWVYGNGWLTCLEPHTGRYWQANQNGEFRTDELTDVW